MRLMNYMLVKKHKQEKEVILRELRTARSQRDFYKRELEKAKAHSISTKQKIEELLYP